MFIGTLHTCTNWTELSFLILCLFCVIKESLVLRLLLLPRAYNIIAIVINLFFYWCGTSSKSTVPLPVLLFMICTLAGVTSSLREEQSCPKVHNRDCHTLCTSCRRLSHTCFQFWQSSWSSTPWLIAKGERRRNVAVEKQGAETYSEPCFKVAGNSFMNN